MLSTSPTRFPPTFRSNGRQLNYCSKRSSLPTTLVGFKRPPRHSRPGSSLCGTDSTSTTGQGSTGSSTGLSRRSSIRRGVAEHRANLSRNRWYVSFLERSRGEGDDFKSLSVRFRASANNFGGDATGRSEDRTDPGATSRGRAVVSQAGIPRLTSSWFAGFHSTLASLRRCSPCSARLVSVSSGQSLQSTPGECTAEFFVPSASRNRYLLEPYPHRHFPLLK